MAETARERLTRSYAYNVYIDGTRTFAEVKPDYHEDVKKYAAANFTQAQIDKALENNWITQEEYSQTAEYMPKPEQLPTEEEPPAGE